MKPLCETCQGARVIRLPVFKSVVTAFDPNAEPTISGPDSRVWPCPQCAPSIPTERLAVVQFHSVRNTQIHDSQYIESSRKHAAHGLAAELLAQDFIRFEEGPADTYQMQIPMVATVGVVSRQHVATFEDRVARRQELIAREVVEEAFEYIRNCNSYYRGRDGEISKGEAIEEVRDAFNAVLRRRKPIG